VKICAAADLHFPRQGRDWCAELARRMCGSGADVLVLAGDIATGKEDAYRALLGLFEGFAGPKLFVPGNHDLWGEADDRNTPQRYRGQLKEIVERYGFRYLPGAPLEHEGIGFVGSAGWYDYGFRQRTSPQSEIRVTPLRALPGDPTTRLRTMNGCRNIPWEDLTTTHYAGRALLWTDDGQLQSMLWNDAVYVDWGEDDASVARRMATEVQADIDRLGEGVDTLVAVYHCVPFEALLGGAAEDVGLAYCRAFMGSHLLGEVLLRDERFRLALCGHAHHQKVLEIGHLVAANCSVANGAGGPLLLTLET
jgi:3',5'-cyclic AMP phosphodiesterase CpdA